jgi:hypothetical protein
MVFDRIERSRLSSVTGRVAFAKYKLFRTGTEQVTVFFDLLDDEVSGFSDRGGTTVILVHLHVERSMETKLPVGARVLSCGASCVIKAGAQAALQPEGTLQLRDKISAPEPGDDVLGNEGGGIQLWREQQILDVADETIEPQVQCLFNGTRFVEVIHGSVKAKLVAD